MSIIKDWKKHRNERIEAAKARGQTKNVVMDTSKVDPKAKAFLEYTSQLLSDAGVVSKETRDQCCYDLFEAMTKSFTVNALNRGCDQDKFLGMMAESLKRAGVTEEADQEEIILKFLKKFKSVGGF